MSNKADNDVVVQEIAAVLEKHGIDVFMATYSKDCCCSLHAVENNECLIAINGSDDKPADHLILAALINTAELLISAMEKPGFEGNADAVRAVVRKAILDKHNEAATVRHS